MKHTKRDSEGVHFTLNCYQLEMLDFITSTLGINPKSTDFKSDRLLRRLYRLRTDHVRPQKSGSPPFAETLILESLLTFALIELSTALNNGAHLPTSTPHYTNQTENRPTLDDNAIPKSWIIQGYYKSILDYALDRARLNATNPTDSNDQD
jgi:hypothetical protein